MYKYQYLQEETKEILIQQKKNTAEFNEYFDISTEKDKKEEKKTPIPPPPEENNPTPRILNSPIKPIYKELSKILHPDKGGDSDEFALVSSMYRDQDSMGIFIKAEEHGVDVSNYLTEELEESFSKSCEILEEEINKIKKTVSWVWCNSESKAEKLYNEIKIRKQLGLKTKKK